MLKHNPVVRNGLFRVTLGDCIKKYRAVDEAEASVKRLGREFRSTLAPGIGVASDALTSFLANCNRGRDAHDPFRSRGRYPALVRSHDHAVED